MPHGFLYPRLLDLRGFEEAMIDFAEEGEALRVLIDKVLQYSLIQAGIRLKSQKPGDVVYFGDDLGMQNGREKGCYVYMHTDGQIYEIMPDLMECGVHMINPQFRANEIDHLERVCRGKIPINLDPDRQLFPFAARKLCGGI